MYTAHIIVAAEVGNNAADVRPLLPMLKAVKDNTGQAPEQLLADAGYRSEKNLEDLAGSGIIGVVALGREGKRCAEVDAQKSPHTATMAAKLQIAKGKGGLPQARMDRRSRQNGWKCNETCQGRDRAVADRLQRGQATQKLWSHGRIPSARFASLHRQQAADPAHPCTTQEESSSTPRRLFQSTCTENGAGRSALILAFLC